LSRNIFSLGKTPFEPEHAFVSVFLLPILSRWAELITTLQEGGFPDFFDPALLNVVIEADFVSRLSRALQEHGIVILDVSGRLLTNLVFRGKEMKPSKQNL
jgi:hypothetical protein